MRELEPPRRVPASQWTRGRRATSTRSSSLGAHAEDVPAGAEAAGVPTEQIVIAAGHGGLGSRLRAYCRTGDLVLLKGSRGAAMERVLGHLRLEPGREPS
jgi:UDP-N-acetylmuramyl pentapeptide synthase